MHKGHGQSGFTLIEILIAMALASLVLFMVAGPPISSRRNLDQSVDNIERLIRFASDEASLQNQFLRMGIDFEDEDQAISLEISDSKDFVIDLEEQRAEDDEDLDEEEKKQKNKKGRFSQIPDFDTTEFSPKLGVKAIAIGSTLTQKLHSDEKPFVYFYPTGEKDSVIIILATEEEMISLTTEPFSQIIKRKYYKLEDVNFSSDDYQEKLLEQAQEIYNEWLTN